MNKVHHQTSPTEATIELEVQEKKRGDAILRPLATYLARHR
jgi:hypothetical protein